MANFEKSFQQAIDDGKINGAIICASDASGRFVYNKTLGNRTLLSGEKKSHEISDILYVASATKLITAIAAMQCVEEGLVSLTADVAPNLPELSGKEVLTGIADDGTPVLEPQAHPITLELLLTHSSGFTYEFMDPNMLAWMKHVGWRDTPRKTVEEKFSHPLSFQPGTKWAYGYGLDWAGKLVERVTGQTLAERVRARVLAPLGVMDAEFYPVTREDLRERMVDLNPTDPTGVGKAVIGGGDVNTGSTDCYGGHSMYISAEDYHKVLRSLLLNDGKMLKPATVEDMFSPHLTKESEEHMESLMDVPEGGPLANGITIGVKKSHGLGSLLQMQDVPGWFGARTLLWGGGFTIAWFVDRQNGLCGIAAPQTTLPADSELLMKLKDDFRKGIYEKYRDWKNENAS